MKRIIISTLIIFTLFLFGTLTTYADTAVTDVVILPAGTRIIEKGEQKQLTRRIVPEDATNQNVTWSIVPESVATINAEGLVTGVEYGSATVTVTTEDGHYTYNKTILVLPTLKYMANGGKITCNNVLSGDEVENRLTQSSDQTNVIAKMESNTKVYEVFERTSGNRCSISYENHTFKGWYTAETGGTKISEDATFVGVRNDDIETVYAQWTDNTVAVTNLELTSSTLSTAIGQKSTIGVIVKPSNATNKELNVNILNSEIATVAPATSCPADLIELAQDGAIYCYDVTGVASGSTTLSFATKDGSNKTATATINVATQMIPIQSFEVYPKNITLAIKTTGGAFTTSETIGVVVKPSNATKEYLSVRSANASVASVEESSPCPSSFTELSDGGAVYCYTIKGMSTGSTQIKIKSTDGGLTEQTINVNVKEYVPINNMTVVQESVSLAPNKQRILQTIITPSNATNKDITWTSSDDNIVTVISAVSKCATITNGTIEVTPKCVSDSNSESNVNDVIYIAKGVAKGTATLTAKTVDGEKVATINVTVSESVDENTISYDCNGGSGSLTSEIVSKNDKIMLKKNVCTKSGYTFKGWKLYANNAVLKDSSSKDYEYADGAIFTNLFGSEKGNLTLKAVWVDKTVPSPKTGISKPFIALFMVAIISLVAFLAVRTKKVEL